MLTLSVVLLGLVLVGYGLHRLLRWAEKRGYVSYLDKPQRRPPTLGLLAQIYKPEMEHVVEEESSQHVRGEDDESGRGHDEDTDG